MFKGQITTKSEEGIKVGLQKWHEYAEKNNHLSKKSQDISTTAVSNQEDMSPQIETCQGEDKKESEQVMTQDQPIQEVSEPHMPDLKDPSPIKVQVVQNIDNSQPFFSTFGQVI